jgi:hypothetical protein
MVEFDYFGVRCEPVLEAEGTVNGDEFYFRARSDQWTLDIGDVTMQGEIVLGTGYSPDQDRTMIAAIIANAAQRDKENG